jgi:hypothetical protein
MSEGTSGWSALPYAQRLKAGGMGDEAESIFEEVYEGKFVRFGFNRPPFRMTNLTSFVRHTPDYCTGKGQLWDCMGLGRDGILKLKVEKHNALVEWNEMQNTGLFVWNSSKGEYAYITIDDLFVLIYGPDGEREPAIRSFNDGNEYYPIKWEDVENKVAVS